MPRSPWPGRVLLIISSVCLMTFGIGAQTLLQLVQSRSDGMTPVVVTRVLDATTLEAQFERGPTERIRLLGIAAVACYDRPAVTRLSDLAKGQPALVQIPNEARDRSGRLYGYVWLGGRLVNEQLVAEGAAVPLQVQSTAQYVDELDAAAAHAREQQLGLWAQCGPSETSQPTMASDTSVNSPPEPSAPSSGDPGGPRQVVPISTWECPVTHSVKAAITEDGAWLYTRANPGGGPLLKPQVCFATESDAQQTGYRSIDHSNPASEGSQ
jgi:endonuclease YncB( thermonuclease family)